MATTKAASTKKATAKKSAAAKTAVRTVRATPKPEVRTVATTVKTKKAAALPNNIINIVFAELFGTFILTLVALLAFKETSALYVGLTLSVLVLAVGAISGAHLNPAVTFGFWAMRKIKTALVPFYWGAQVLGAMLAVIVTFWLSGNKVSLNFEHFGAFNPAIFGIELIGMAVFMFGIAAVVANNDLKIGTKSLGIGLSLTVALLVGGSVLSNVQSSIDTAKIASIEQVPRELRVKGAVLNPAIAVAATESPDSSFTGTRPDGKEKQYSRFGTETIVGALVGAAIGGNLYLLLAGRRKNS